MGYTYGYPRWSYTIHRGTKRVSSWWKTGLMIFWWKCILYLQIQSQNSVFRSPQRDVFLNLMRRLRPVDEIKAIRETLLIHRMKKLNNQFIHVSEYPVILSNSLTLYDSIISLSRWFHGNRMWRRRISPPIYDFGMWF